jgi:hypothetical protein
VLASWALERAELAGVCDAACALSACREAVAAALGMLATAAAALDEARARVVISGTALCEDLDGDLVVDGLSATSAVGAWTSADGTSSEPLAATFYGLRMTTLP